MTANPFLQPYRTPHHTAPFDRIRNDHYLPALAEGLRQARHDIDAITGNTQTPTFANTVVALEQNGDLLGRVASVMFNLNSAETSDELQRIVREASPQLTEFSNDVSLNETLFARLKAVYDQRETLHLDGEDAMLLDKKYKGFVRNGANLDETSKERLRTIDRELAQLSLAFGENVLAETNAYTLHLTTEADLDGLPDFVREAARQAAADRNLNGYIVTLQAPSYLPFMQYANNRALRRQLYVAYHSRGFHNDSHDNQAIIAQLVALRHERANLLGYATHADFVLEENMAETPKKVQTFLDELIDYATPAARQQLAELTDYAHRLGFADAVLQPWDQSYYAEKLKKEKYDLDDEMLKPYFPLEQVLEGVFAVAGQLFGLRFQRRTDIPVYHPDVRTYDVLNADGNFVAVFYGDYFPRTGKRGGAWMSDVQGQKIQNGENIRPHILNVCNFTPPTPDKPSLLSFSEVTTLFHEFGHALHGMLANGKYESLTGTNVARDFVELPSQLMENWCYNPEALQLFARHYQTGEVIPMALIEKIQASQQFLAGLATLRQLRFGILDMYYHGQTPTAEPIIELERKVDARTNLFPAVEGVAVSPAFSHIFAGGYSAGYYSYKWSEVLDADAFEMFDENGGLNAQEAAKLYRQFILEKGSSEQPMALYKKFRGREPSPKAMLRRSGLLTN